MVPRIVRCRDSHTGEPYTGRSPTVIHRQPDTDHPGPAGDVVTIFVLAWIRGRADVAHTRWPSAGGGGGEAPKPAEDLIPGQLSLGAVVTMLQNLVSEDVPVSHIRAIAETLAEQSTGSQDPATLTAAARTALGRMIFQNINGMNKEPKVITLALSLEQILHQALRSGDGLGPALEPRTAEKMHKVLLVNARHQEAAGQPVVLLAPGPVRSLMVGFVKHSPPSMHVLAYNQIPDNKRIKAVTSVGGGCLFYRWAADSRRYLPGRRSSTGRAQH